MSTQNKPVTIGYSESALERRERLLAVAAAKREEEQKQKAELNNFVNWFNESETVAFIK